VAEAEALLSGKTKDEATRNLAQAGAIAGRAAQAISDLHGAQDYKEHIVGVLLKRTFQAAVS
jgi:CO/xanthine dehydrogenase FAD-binding subunit